LSRMLGVPVVEVNSRTGRGIKELAAAAHRAVGREAKVPRLLDAAGEAGDNRIFGRYKFISDVVQASVIHRDRDAHRISDKIDSVLTHRFWGLIVLVALLLVIFQAIFSWATIPMDLMDQGFGALGTAVRGLMPEGMLTDLMVDGIIAGVGGILVFLPQIML